MDDELLRWIGRTEVAYDVLGPTPVHALRATLDLDPVAVDAGFALPPL